MSIDIMNRIWWREDLPTMEKFVALALGDAANDEGMCYPAVATIARKCSCSARTVQNALRGLEGKQILRVKPRTDRSSYYIFNLANLPHIDRDWRPKEKGPQHETTGAGDSPDLFGTGESGSGTGESGSVTGAGDSPRTINETSIEPSYITDREICDAFVERWNAMAAEIPALSSITKLGDKRKSSLLARIGEYEPKKDRARVLALIDRVIKTVGGSRYLRGEVNPWKATPDFVVTPKYFPKLEEAGYVQDAVPGADQSAARGGRSHVATGQAVAELLDARRGSTRPGARELAGLPPKRAADAR